MLIAFFAGIANESGAQSAADIDRSAQLRYALLTPAGSCTTTHVRSLRVLEPGNPARAQGVTGLDNTAYVNAMPIPECASTASPRVRQTRAFDHA
jgi:hypothetical protein